MKHKYSMTRLVIVESPAKCSKIEGFLGSEYKCIASFGHIRKLANLQNIDIQNKYNPTYEIDERKVQQVAKIRKCIETCDEVILATDDDREGEAIAWHICDVFKLPVSTTKRIVFHEITESAILNAVNHPGTINMDMVHAQQARQILDLLVGFTISPILWKYISRKTKQGLSAGRCQSPALKLIYENQKEIDECPGDIVYNTTGYFSSQNLLFTLNEVFNTGETASNFLEASVNHVHMFTKEAPKQVYKNPPIPFITSSLQQKCNSELRISPKETMQICQKLYEGGYITYMRTDCAIYSKEFIDDAKSYITKTWSAQHVKSDIESLAEPVKKPKSKSKKDTSVKAQEAHEAIRPTDICLTSIEDSEFSPREKKVYNLIWSHTCESCMERATYLHISCNITGPIQLHYKMSVEQVVFPGWKVVNGYEKENKHYYFIEKLTTNSIMMYNKLLSKTSIKNAKSHINEAKLVQLLEQHGIGRPSTFSSIIDKIQDREYVKKDNVVGKQILCTDYELIDCELNEINETKTFGAEKDRLIIQPVGIMVMEFLEKHFAKIVEYAYTQKMENLLDDVAKGSHIWHELCNICYTELNELIENIGDDEERQQIKIDDNHVYMIAKYGPVIKCIQDGETTFKKAKNDLDMKKLQTGQYAISDIVDTSKKSGKVLGKYKGEDIHLKKGKFGIYIEYGTANKISLKFIGKEEHEITLDDVISYIEKPKDVMITLSGDCSIRRGKFGPYIFYKTKTDTKPKFLSLNGFKQAFGQNEVEGVLEDISDDDDELKTWIQTKHKIRIYTDEALKPHLSVT